MDDFFLFAEAMYGDYSLSFIQQQERVRKKDF